MARNEKEAIETLVPDEVFRLSSMPENSIALLAGAAPLYFQRSDQDFIKLTSDFHQCHSKRGLSSFRPLHFTFSNENRDRVLIENRDRVLAIVVPRLSRPRPVYGAPGDQTT